jgi:hypothetical protein
MIFLSAGVAQYKGFFKDEGLDAEIVVMDGLNLLIDLTKKDAKINREIPISEVADFSILKEVQMELGLR